MAVPYTFGSATSAIPLSQLDSNFATTITLGNTAIQLGNTVTTLNNMTLANVTISSGNVTITNVSVTTANVTTLNAATVIATTGNITTVNATTVVATTANATTANITTGNLTDLNLTNNPTFSGGTANGVLYLNASKVATSGSALTFDGTTLYNSGNISVGGNSGGNRYVALLNETGTYTGTLILQAGGGSAAYGGAVVMYGHSHASYPGAVYVGSSAGTSTGIIFGGGGNAGPVTSEWMRLTSTGLGIGTSSPGTKLQVNGTITASTTGQFFVSNGASTTNQYFNILNTGGSFFLGVENSSGGSLATGSSAYSSLFTTQGATSLQLGTNLTVRATIDPSGNLGLGVVPSAWGSGYKSLDIGSVASFFSDNNVTANVSANQYIDAGGRKYKTTNYATMYQQYNGQHQWYYAASGTAGNAITFTQAMTLFASGGLSLGNTSDPGATNLSVTGTAKAGIVHLGGNYTAGATTPSVTGISYMPISNSSATTITNFTGAVTGQIIYLYFADANTTINRANARLAGSTNFTSTQYATLALLYNGTEWIEICRSTTNG